MASTFEDAPNLAARTQTTTPASASGLSSPPPGHGLRRSKTAAETSPARHRPPMTQVSSEESFQSPPRRSSNFSTYSLGEARDILNPKPSSDETLHSDSSSLASLSLAFALLPALAGAVFKNGSAVVTDVMLLGLAAVFLNWSVTQPWSWYRSAQEIRVREETVDEAITDEEDDCEAPESAGATKEMDSSLEDVPEEGCTAETERPSGAESLKHAHEPYLRRRRAALSELYVHEMLALLSCLVLPVLAAFSLHAIRSQLSRPSEGLVSNYNLTIFLLVSELRVFSHMLKLVRSRALHLQRVVHENPFAPRGGRMDALDELRMRLENLESHPTASEATVQQLQASFGPDRAKQEGALVRSVRNTIQPELDALNRAVRRYEKKATLLQYQTEARFASLDARLDDAIALAAAAAKKSTANKNMALSAVESMARILLFPITTVLRLVVLPFTTLLAVATSRGRAEDGPHGRSLRASRAGGRGHGQSKHNPGRASKTANIP